MPVLKNPKHEVFAQKYASGLTANKAFEAAGFAPNDGNCFRLKNQPDVMARILELLEEISAKAIVERVDILKELLLIARADISQAYDLDGELLPVHKMPEDVRRAISGIDVEEITNRGEKIGFVKKVRFWEKTKALELLGKHLKLFTEVQEHKGGIKVTIEDLTE